MKPLKRLQRMDRCTVEEPNCIFYQFIKRTVEIKVLGAIKYAVIHGGNMQP
jgi:hypothetical protein